ncbi:Hypothetical protein, putative [Bodo saltans]|uniref:Uncharacterized protein n=1 Tax=Bodo saltans TaxID=75058 RepID=A0A0S4J6K2_BODSA|nr:Hypothetical protein, putative [Bodo saltans]|eukprot:CUG85609.1 Hypothetical protein, putative [Bodo saltans]
MSLQTMIVVFGPTGTFVGEPSSFTPTRAFPPISSLCTHSWRIDSGAVAADAETTTTTTATEGQWPTLTSSSSLPAGTSDVISLLKGKRVVTTVATDCSRAALEQFVANMFRVLGAANLREVVVIGKALASSMAYGHERTRVVDIGFEAVTCSFVVSGVTEGCSTSRTLGVRKFLRGGGGGGGVSHVVAATTHAATTEMQVDWSALEAAFLGEGAHHDLSKAPLLRLLKQLPVESRKGAVPVLITGDAVDHQPSMFHRLTNLLQPVIATLEGGNIAASSPTSPTAANNSSTSLITHSRPALMHFTGASLLASLCGHMCDAIAVTRTDASSLKGLEMIHSRCPGIHRPLQQAASDTSGAAAAAA